MTKRMLMFQQVGQFEYDPDNPPEDEGIRQMIETAVKPTTSYTFNEGDKVFSGIIIVDPEEIGG